jgi:hypothetical protein
MDMCNPSDYEGFKEQELKGKYRAPAAPHLQSTAWHHSSLAALHAGYMNRMHVFGTDQANRSGLHSCIMAA